MVFFAVRVVRLAAILNSPVMSCLSSLAVRDLKLHGLACFAVGIQIHAFVQFVSPPAQVSFAEESESQLQLMRLKLSSLAERWVSRSLDNLRWAMLLAVANYFLLLQSCKRNLSQLDIFCAVGLSTWKT